MCLKWNALFVATFVSLLGAAPAPEVAAARTEPPTMTTRPATQSLRADPDPASADAPPALGRRGSRFARRFEGATPTTHHATRPVAKFDPSLFAYDPASTRDVIWATPTFQQTLIYARPPVTRPTAATVALKGPVALPAPASLANVDLRWFAFHNGQGNWVPGLLATPAGKAGPFPLVLATHGLLSHKMQVISQVAPSLTERGFAVVAIDLPFHGERAGWGPDLVDPRNPQRMSALWTEAVTDLRRALDLSLSLPIVDARRPAVALGYSLGSWMSVITGAADPRVGALVLMVGGATELDDALLGVPSIANADPRVAAAAFAPRPLLLVSGRNDRTVTPEMARRLFEAAREPKEHRWYDMGHLLKDPAFTETATWIVDHVGAKR